MPARDTVREVLDLARQNVHYKVLRTTEMDAYDPVPGPKTKPGPK
jgi:hypothetical protein